MGQGVLENLLLKGQGTLRAEHGHPCQLSPSPQDSTDGAMDANATWASHQGPPEVGRMTHSVGGQHWALKRTEVFNP